jgi:Lon-like ATP-dependent protease
MDLELEMEGACVPWQNRQDIKPLLINGESEYNMKGGIPSIKIYRSEGKRAPGFFAGMNEGK